MRTMPRKSHKALPPTEAGLFHDADAFPGTEAFNLYGQNGQRIGRWSAVEGMTDTELIEAFLDFLARREPRLFIIPAAPPRAS